MSIRNGRADRLDQLEQRYEMTPRPITFIICTDEDERHDADEGFRFTLRFDRRDDTGYLSDST